MAIEHTWKHFLDTDSQYVRDGMALQAAANEIARQSGFADQMMRDEYAAVLAQENPTYAQLDTVWCMESRRRWYRLPKDFGRHLCPLGYDPSPDVLEEIQKVHPQFDPGIEERPPRLSVTPIETLKRLFEEADRSRPKAKRTPGRPLTPSHDAGDEKQ